MVDIQSALRQPQNYYFNAKATGIDNDAHTVQCVDVTGIKFSCSYDVLAITTGSQVFLLLYLQLPNSSAADAAFCILTGPSCAPRRVC